MKILALTPQERVFLQATHKVIVTWEDLAAGAAAAAQTLQIFPTSGDVPVGTVVRWAGSNLTTAFDFSDASINSLTLTVGDDGDVDRFLTSTELAADGTEIIYKTTAASSQPYAYNTANGIDAVFTASGGGDPLASEATSGVVEIYLTVMDMNDLEASQ